ncbi:MAG: hypothetical protein CM15mP51_09610 [Porticoccaceae bacterium]|nr:MAG: hypothetical protein CM15mP51_09610 [Porticoccaceae bacterium]
MGYRKNSRQLIHDHEVFSSSKILISKHYLSGFFVINDYLFRISWNTTVLYIDDQNLIAGPDLKENSHIGVKKLVYKNTSWRVNITYL